LLALPHFLFVFCSASSHDAVELSVEHQIDTAFAERERLLAAHPYEEDLLRSNRVKGRLQPTRGVGDGVYKKNEFFAARDRLRERYGTWTAPYTTADPDITAYKLSPRDEFLVLASDGLFQELTPALVTKYVGEFMADASARDRHKGNCAAFLTEKALLHASEYAIGRRGAEKNLAWVLSLPTEAKRNFHDDITVMVLFFTKELAAGLPPKVMDTATGGRITAPATLQRAIRDAQTATAAAGAAAAMARGAPLDTVAESVLTVNDLVSSPPQELRANL
jgi:serine/threonine protein phosphatase PrpC